MRSLKDLGKKIQRRHTVSEPAVWDQTEEILLAELLRNCLQRREVGRLTAERLALSGPLLRQQPAAIHDRLLQALQPYFSEHAQKYRQRTQLDGNRPTLQSSSGWQEWLVNDLLGFRNRGGLPDVLSLASVFAVSTSGNAERAASDAHWIAVAEKCAERRQEATTDDLAARAQEITAALRAARGRKTGGQPPSSKNKAQ
ncbi:MAG: hypothetical protein ACRERD_30165 [Candidatus Binatia bacterium]